MARHMRRRIDAFGGIAAHVVLVWIAAKVFAFSFPSSKLVSLEITTTSSACLYRSRWVRH